MDEDIWLGVSTTLFQCNINFLLKSRNFVKQLKILPRLPYTQVSSIICTDQVCYALLEEHNRTNTQRGEELNFIWICRSKKNI